MTKTSFSRRPQAFFKRAREQASQRALALPSKVGWRGEGAMDEGAPRAEETDPSGAVQLRGILISLSNRFYTGGWGYGQLQTETTVVKITGALEGHVTGTSVIVRGTYKRSQYGLEVECSSIMVDSVSGELSVIQSWARKRCKKHESLVMQAVRQVRAPDRWALLLDAGLLVNRGVGPDEAEEIAKAAQSYMESIKTKRALMELGFTDTEAEKLFQRYAAEAMQVIEEDPYTTVLERVLPFARLDTVVQGRFERNDPRRLQAAMMQALVGVLRDGHTAMSQQAMLKLAADVAGVYVDAIARTQRPREVVEHAGYMQIRRIAYQEQDIALWIHRAAEIEDSG